MFVPAKYRKIFEIIRKCATRSIEMSQKNEMLKPGIKYLEDHFLFDLPMERNLKIAKILAKSIPKNSKVLDWGCGYGDASYMLSALRPDLDITLFDVLTSDPWEVLTNKIGFEKIIGSDEIMLPFKNNRFDAVIGIGVLEHVKDQNASLAEINRVLKPNGKFYVLLYPNKLSYTEMFQRIIGNPYHDKPFQIDKLVNMLEINRFRVISSKYELMMPFVLSRFPYNIRRIYNLFGNIIIILNDFSEKIPFLNKFGSNITIVAQK